MNDFTPTVVLDLRRASLYTDNQQAAEVVRAHALRIAHCAEPRNQFKLHGRPTRAWRCNSKLCDFCVQRSAWKNRQRLRNALSQVKLPTGTKLRFITFTIKNPNLSLLQTRELIERTWRKFSKTRLFADLFRGGAKSEEFTVTDNGFHFHIHALAATKYIHFNELRRVWTDCFQQAALDLLGQKQLINTTDGRLLIKVLEVSDREQIVFEVCKYITKTYRLGHLDDSVIGQLALIRRWPRSFELFGCFASVEEKPILDNENLSAGTPRQVRQWFDLVLQFGLPTYSLMLESEVHRRIDFYKSNVKPEFQWQHEALPVEIPPLA